jgi:hypothetical protein
MISSTNDRMTFESSHMMKEFSWSNLHKCGMTVDSPAR